MADFSQAEAVFFHREHALYLIFLSCTHAAVVNLEIKVVIRDHNNGCFYV